MAELMDKQGILDELRRRSGGAQQEQTPLMDKQQILDSLRQKASGQGTGTFAPVKQDKTAKDFIKQTAPQQQETPKWFQSGAFADGYQFGDLAKTWFGTQKDVRENLYSGVVGAGEKTLDFLLSIAPYLSGASPWSETAVSAPMVHQQAQQQQTESAKDLVSGVVEKDLIDEQKVAQTMDKITGGIGNIALIGEKADDVSVLGEKTDSIVQSLGQMALTKALGGMVPWWVVTGATSLGGEAENAVRQGASLDQAVASGLISAGAEVLSEKLFGGSGLGEKGFLNLDALTSGIANKLWKTLADYGVDMASEGLEEVFSSVVSNLGSALYREEKLVDILASEEALQEYLDSFVSGAVVSGMMNAGDLAASLKGGNAAQQPQSATQGGETAEPEKVLTQAETGAGGQQTAQAVQKTATSNQQTMTPQQAMQETIAEIIGVPSVSQAVESYRESGTVTNKQAEAIASNANAVQELLEMAGIAKPPTKSQTRAAVKQAVAKLAQESVDNTPTGDYDRITNQGGVNDAQRLQQNDRAGGFGDPAQGMARVQPADRAEYEGRQQPGGMAVSSGVLRLSSELQQAQAKKGTPTYSIYDTTSEPVKYEQALKAGRESDAVNGWCVTPKSAQELADGNVRTIMNENGTVGAGIAPDGDIVAVFKNKNGGPKKALHTLMPAVIEQGGDRLDCYGNGLVGVYAQYGFIPVARVEFNPEYANEGWTPDKGTPYIYFMMHNGDSAATVAEKIGTYPEITKQQLDALPTFGKEAYDDAMAYRDNFIAQRKSQPANAKIASESTGADATIAESVVPTDSTTTARPEIRNDEAWEDYQRRLAEWEAQQNQTSGFSSVGAANAGFSKPSPVDPLIEQYGSLPSGENPVRSDELPKSVTGQDRVSQTAVTVKGAQATPDDFVDMLDEDVAKGGMSYIPIKNSDTVRKASDYIKRNGWQQALANWNAAVDAGNSNADLVAQGALFYNNAVNAGDRTAALDILHSYQQIVRNSARGLQVARILKTLTPSDKLYMIEKTIRKFNEKTGLDIEVDENLLAEYRALANSKDASFANELDSVIEKGAKKAADSVLLGLEEESLATRLGRRVSDRLTSEAKKQNATLEDILFRDIMRFANDKASQDASQQTQSVNENLRALGDYFKYQYLFQDAWNVARSRVEDALWQMDQNDPRVQTIKNFLVNGGEFGGIENTDPLSALDIYNQHSTLRKGTKEAAEKAGILMKNKISTQPKVKAKLRDILIENAKNKQAAADLIAQTAVQELGLTGDEAAAISEDITRAFYQDLAEQSADRLASIFGEKQVTKQQKLGIVEKLERYYNMGAFTDAQYRDQAFQKVFGEDMDLDIPNHLLERLTSAEDAKRDAIIDEIKKSVADQIPSTFMDKVNALRYLNMLGNPKTQVRNLAGNATMAAVSAIKDEVGAGIELIANKVSGGKVKRTKSFGVSKAQLAAAKNDFDSVKEIVTGERRYDDKNSESDDFLRSAMQQKRVFKANNKVINAAMTPLEGYRKLTSAVMEKGDLLFSKPAYARALAGYFKANGITETDYSKIDQEFLDEARLYAINEAQEQTFRDTNMLAEAVSKRYRGSNKILKAGDALLNAIIPFRKTPANVLLRAEEYSPLGIANALWNTVQAGRDGSDVTANDAINSWAKSLTGTGLFFLGALLSNLGLLSAGADEDKEKEGFESLSGYQNYAFVARGGTNVTIEFLSPAAIPLLMGAEFWESVNENGLTLDAVWDTAMSMTEPMIQMSMLQSLNDTIEDVRYSDDPSGQIVVNAALNYLMQATTNTLFGQLERGTEDVRMTTYVDKNSPVPDWLQKALGKASAKTPIWEYNQIPYINAWGEEEKNLPTGLNLVYNLLSPGYVESGRKDALTEELNRLGTSTGENVYPDRAPTYITVGGEKKNLSAEEYVAFAKDRGQTQKKLMDQLLASSAYNSLTDAQKAKAVKKVYEYADRSAKKRAEPGYDDGLAKWIKQAANSGNLAEAIINWSKK